MHFRVGIERKPVANKGQPVGEVEGAKTRARIVAAVLAPIGGGGEAEKALQECVDSDGSVALPTPDRRALEAKFEILRGPEADLLKVHPRVARIDHILCVEYSRRQRRHLSVPSE